MIVVERAPPYLTVQDTGRIGYRASGVPRAGAVDQWSLGVANALVGNPSDAAALEWAIGAGSLRFERDAIVALTGAGVEATIDDSPVTMSSALSVRARQVLTIHRLMARRFLYISVRGGVDSPPVLGSRSTYLPASLGGIGGRRLVRDDVIPIGNPIRSAAVPTAPDRVENGPDYDAEVIRIVPAIAESLAGENAATGFRGDSAELLEKFLETSYVVSMASDRTGYRLEADRPLAGGGASITSEAVCAGVIQLPPGGHPIVLMSDSPTIGGYRILGTVISCDLPIVAQCMPGRTLRFSAVTVDVAQEELRRREG
jgi:antagonist of KipI